MAEFNSISEINENFDTIKTLLNSIRAQGILNTSDVDKLLSGINSKLEKINTEEDIDLIKIFLSELKQNLEERHNVLISKFGAIESLFSNLLKNSSEMPKSAELKELFDIVATNLSVFSREVVSQKETLTDITLRLDALRSDDSQKRDIIKNISLLKPDLERLNNGFDSIVLSLNDNFKTIIKTISSFDKTEYFDRFSDVLTGMEMSSNTILSAVQMLDKKTEQVETALENLATQDDIKSANEHLSDLSLKNKELTESINDLSNRYIVIDNLAEKIDASVDIIASLKAVIENIDNQNTTSILNKLSHLEAELQTISSDAKFEEFRTSLESTLKVLQSGTSGFEGLLSQKGAEITKEINSAIQKLTALQDANTSKILNDIATKTESTNSAVQKILTSQDANTSKVLNDIATRSDASNSALQKFATLQDANITRVLNDISTSADALNSKLAQTQASIATLCDKNFGTVFENISNVKTLIAQIDENSVSANNAIFSNITDRLTVFENSLKASLDIQEKNVSESTVKLIEQVENIKNLSSVLDYKMDSTVVESGNVKRELSALKESVDAVLALDFVNTVKDLRVDLYASKQELMNTVETTNIELSDKITNDLYGKYELLISKLDNVEDEFKNTQSESLLGLKGILENISSSIVDVISYVSEQKSDGNNDFSGKLDEISNIVSETNLNYIESVREIIDVAKVSVNDSLKNITDSNNANFENLQKTISDNSEDLKKDIKFSYSKLLEIQDSYKEIKEILNLNNIDSSDKFDGILASAQDVKSNFETQIISLKGTLLDKISEFKQEFTCSNADKVSELKFAVETLYSKNAQEVTDLLTELKVLFDNFTTDDNNSRAATLAKILDNFVALKSFLTSLNDKTAENVKEQVDIILNDFANVKEILEKVDENVDGDMTRQLSIIESNFESLVSQITILFDKSNNALSEKINEEFSQVSQQLQDSMSEKLESYKLKIEETFDKLQNKTVEQSNYLQNRIAELNTAMKSVWEEQSDSNFKQLEEIAEKLKGVLDDNIKLTAIDYISFKEKLSEFAKNIETNNTVLTQDLKAQLDDITKYINSILDIQAQENEERQEELLAKHTEQLEHLNKISESLATLENKQEESIEESEQNTQQIISDIKLSQASVQSKISDSSEKILAGLETSTENIQAKNSEILNNIEDLSAQIQAKSTERAENYCHLSAKLADLEANQDGFKKDASQNALNIVSKIQTSHSETIKTMAELSAVTAGQLEDIKTATKDAIDTVQEISKSQFDILQATHNDIINNVEDINNTVEKQFEALTQTANINISNQIELTQTAHNEQMSALNEIKAATEEHQNYSKIAQSDILQALDDIRGLNEEQIQVNDNITDNLASLTQICANNNRLITKAEDTAVERHENIVIKTDNILNTVKSIESTASNTSAITSSTKDDIADLAKNVADNKALLGHLDESLNKSVSALNALTAEISAGELQTLDSYVNTLLEQIEEEKENVKTCKNLIVDFTKKELDLISKNIEKETDVIIGDLVEQFDILRQSQTDDISILTSKIEEIVSSQIYNNIEDLKSYLDIKTDNSILSEKLDNLKIDMLASVDDIIDDLDKMLLSGEFRSEISSLRSSVESLVSSTSNDLNNKLIQFISQNFNENTNKIEEKLTLFDKKFVDAIVDKSEEIQLISNLTQDSLNTIQNSLNKILTDFDEARKNTDNKIDELAKSIDNTNNSVSSELHALVQSFEGLRSQISNKSFDEAFQASIDRQIRSLEDLIYEQTAYIEDVSELCEINLPEVAELNALVKHSVLESLNNLSEKLDSQDIDKTINNELQQLKADIITQFLNVFNQISFVTEQEEILDFVHEKHEELITILSHIVTSTSDIEDIKENVVLVDNKIDSLKEDIDLINEKITAIISAEGDIDYVYSLQDLESDIATLRVELNSMKDNDHSKEFQDLITSTNDIYTLVESIKTELPKQKDFESIAEDIVSISTRTNKLILASDESYKALQDNLEDFKLVINDLDERTKNFAQDSGMDKVNAKLNAINSMMEKGAKTNQVFNQVFEYLAEWVDNASVQINTITDRVETLGEIGQIKDMLADLKAGAEDNSETIELIDALGAVFDKQNKKITSLEAKLDKLIVETTINNKTNQIDLSPMEDTLNRFLVAMDQKMSAQQNKINTLETRLADVLELLDGKETAQLTKKVGGMDRQIAKLNKSIEKIASHVIER